MIDWLIRFAKRTPYRHLPGYMERYWLLPYGRGPVAVRLHRILRSDNDRVFHDHPWWYLSVILRGGYWETKPVFESGMLTGTTRKWYGPGSVLLRSPRSWHRLEIPEGKDAWTLFATGPKRQRWGFLREPEFKTYWREYLNSWDVKGTPDA